MSEYIVNYIYLLQEREFIKTNENIYKIGMTKKQNNKRFNQYPKGSILLFQMICNDCVFIEKQLIKIFKETFIKRIDIGNEYFEGIYNDMINIIFSTIKNEKEITDNEKQIQHNRSNMDINMSNQKHECIICNYTSFRKNNYDRHILSSKHIHKTHKKVKKHKCSMCNFECNNPYNYNLHLSCKKHIQNLKNQEINKNITSLDMSTNIIDISMNNVEIFKNEIISTLMNKLNFVLEENKNILAEQT